MPEYADKMSVKAVIPIIDSCAIAKRVGELAEQLDAFYGNSPLCMICVLKGAFIFFGDLARALHNANLELDFVQLSSYAMGTVSTKQIVVKKDIGTDIRGKHVLVVEDIVDSGLTTRFLMDRLATRGPLSLKLITLIDKTERRSSDIRVDFAGFNVQRGFMVGYGLDYAEKFRGLPDICEIVFDDL